MDHLHGPGQIIEFTPPEGMRLDDLGINWYWNNDQFTEIYVPPFFVRTHLLWYCMVTAVSNIREWLWFLGIVKFSGYTAKVSGESDQ